MDIDTSWSFIALISFVLSAIVLRLGGGAGSLEGESVRESVSPTWAAAGAGAEAGAGGCLRRRGGMVKSSVQRFSDRLWSEQRVPHPRR